MEDFKRRLESHIAALTKKWINTGVDTARVPAPSELAANLISLALKDITDESTPIEIHLSLATFLLEHSDPVMLAILTPFLEFREHSPLLTINQWNGDASFAESSSRISSTFDDPFMQQYRDTQLRIDDLRRKFHAKDVASIPTWDGCHNLYEPGLETARIPYPKNVPIYCTAGMNLGIPTIVPQDVFKKNWSLLTNGLFDGMNWTNVVAAGGAVLACALPGFTPAEYGDEGSAFVSSLHETVALQVGQPVDILPSYLCGLNGFWTTDIDLFIHSCSTEEATKVIDRIIATVTKNNDSATVMRSSFAITIFGLNPHRDVQIVFRLYSRPCEVIHGFDIDCAGIAFDGSDVYVTERCLQALRCRLNVVNMTYRSTTYSMRLLKYSYRDFAIAVPGYDRNLGIPHVLPPKMPLSHDAVWDKSAFLKHTRADVEQRYIRCLADIRTSGATSFLRTKVAPELSAIIAEDIKMHHMRYCTCSNTASSEGPYPLKIGGFRGPVCQCKVAKASLKDLTSFILTITLRKNIADINAKQVLRSERRDFAQGRRHYTEREDVTCELVESAPLEDNSVEAVFRIINTDSRGLDPLSVAYAYQHDYATPSSTGFHSKASLQWADKSPRCVNGIFIGPLSYVIGAAPLTLLVDNPGRQGLLTSSFHPLINNGFYGDMRWFIGPYTYVDPLMSAITERWNNPGTDIIVLFFYINHFYSHPSYLARILEASQEERRCRELADTALECFSSGFTSLASIHNTLTAGKKAAEDGMLACEESVKQLNCLEEASQSYAGSRRVQNNFEVTITNLFDFSNNKELEQRAATDPVFQTQYVIFKSIVQFFSGITTRRHSLVTWKTDCDRISRLMVDFDVFVQSMRIALLKGQPFKNEQFNISSTSTYTPDWLATRQKLAETFYKHTFEHPNVTIKVDFSATDGNLSLKQIRGLSCNENLDPHELLLKATNDNISQKYIYHVPRIERVDQVDTLFNIVHTTGDGVNGVSHCVTMAPDFTSCCAELSFTGESLIRVLEIAYSIDEVLYLLKDLVAVLKKEHHVVLDPQLRNVYIANRTQVIIVSAPANTQNRYLPNVLCSIAAIQKIISELIAPAHPVSKAINAIMANRDTARDDVINPLVDTMFAMVDPYLSIAFEATAFARCDIINVVYRGLKAALNSAVIPVTHTFERGADALEMLSVFKTDNIKKLASQSYTFATGGENKTDGEYCELLLNACRKEGALVYNEETGRYTFPTGKIQMTVVETLRRLGRLLIWAFLHQRRLPLRLSNLLVAIIKHGITYTYSESTLHTVAVDADNAQSVSTLLQSLVEGAGNGTAPIQEFTSATTGIRYLLSEKTQDAPLHDTPTICVASLRVFAALYCTNEYIHSRSMAIRAFMDDGGALNMMQQLSQMSGVNLREVLSMRQLYTLFMDNDCPTL